MKKAINTTLLLLFITFLGGFSSYGYDFPSGHTVTGNEVWTNASNPAGHSGPLTLTGNLIIPQGCSLTISNMEIDFDHGSGVYIRVDHSGSATSYGGQLILTNTTFTAISDNWEGIGVGGNTAYTQRSLTVPAQYYQGYLKLDGCTISYANKGIQLGADDNGAYQGGGILEALNTTFYNNLESIKIFDYINLYNAWGTASPGTAEATNHCGIALCNFSNDDDLFSTHFTSGQLTVMIDAGAVHGIGISGCSFVSNMTDLSASGYGIIGSGLIANITNVIPLGGGTITPSLFQNLSIAIENSDPGPGSAWYKPGALTIYRTKFDNCSLALYLRGTGFDHIYNCEFDLQNRTATSTPFYSSGIIVGAYVTGCTGYKISNNEFNGATNDEALSAEASGSDPNIIAHNSYSGLDEGNKSQSNNYGSVGGIYSGLQFLCNSYVGNIYDEEALATNPGDGMAPKQGTAFRPAGNVFTASTSRVNLYNDGEPITYYYESGVTHANPTTGGSGSTSTTTALGVAPCSSDGMGTGNSPAVLHPNFISALGNSSPEAYDSISNNITYYLTDSNGTQRRDSLYYWAGQLNTAYGDLLKVKLFIGDSMIDSANNVYGNIVSKFNLAGQESNEFSTFGSDLVDIWIYLRANGNDVSTLTGTQVTTLENMIAAGNSHMWPQKQAEAIMFKYDGSTYLDSIFEPTPLPKQPLNTPITFQAVNKIYPNPAQSVLNVDYTCSTNTSAQIQILDIVGRTLLTQELPKSGLSIVDISSLAPGMYLYKIMEGKNITLQDKISKD